MKLTNIYYINFVLCLVIFTRTEAQWVQTNGPYCGDVSSLFLSGENIYATTVQGGKFLSSNNGDTWLPLRNQIPGVITSFNNSLYVGNLNGIFISTDNGENWDKINSGLANITTIEIIDSVLFIGTQFGLYCSRNFGYGSLESAGLDEIPVSSITGNDTLLFIGTYESGVYRFSSIDSNWINLGLQYNYISSIKLSNDVVFVGSVENGVFYSTNYGTDWINTNLPASVQTLFANDTIVVAGTVVGGYIYITLDFGQNWLIRQPNIAVNATIVLGENIYVGVTRDGILRSSDYGLNWEIVNQGITGNITSCARNDNDIIVGTAFNGVYISTDNGDSWRSINKNIYQVNSLTSRDSIIIAGSTNQIFYSLNKGETWSNSSFFDGQINCLNITDTDTYLGSTNGVYVSSNYGETWNNLNFPGFPGYRTVFMIFAIGDTLWVGSQNGVYLTSDNGIHWQYIGLGNYYITAISKINDNLLAGTLNGDLYLSSDNGTNWELINQNLQINNRIASISSVDTSYIICIKEFGVYISSVNNYYWVDANSGLLFRNTNFLFSNDSYLFVGTGTGSIWRRPISDLTHTSDTEPIVIKDYSLRQNYPNPFNPSTNISYSIQHGGFVILTVYDVLGNEIITLVNEEKPNGNYEVIFNSKNLSSGVYFYQLRINNFISTKKMVVIK